MVDPLKVNWQLSLDHFLRNSQLRQVYRSQFKSIRTISVEYSSNWCIGPQTVKIWNLSSPSLPPQLNLCPQRRSSWIFFQAVLEHFTPGPLSPNASECSWAAGFFSNTHSCPRTSHRGKGKSFTDIATPAAYVFDLYWSGLRQKLKRTLCWFVLSDAEFGCSKLCGLECNGDPIHFALS